MERIKKTKNLFVNKPILVRFLLKKNYSKKEGGVEGGITITAKKEITITHVTMTIKQYTDTSTMKKAGKKQEKILAPIGEKKIAGPWTIEMFKEHRIEFYIPLSFNKANKKESKMYKGDMALMDRLHDESQKTMHSYEIEAEIKIKGERKPLIFSHTLTIQ